MRAGVVDLVSEEESPSHAAVQSPLLRTTRVAGRQVNPTTNMSKPLSKVVPHGHLLPQRGGAVSRVDASAARG